jgi:hypothetical protein
VDVGGGGNQRGGGDNTKFLLSAMSFCYKAAMGFGRGCSTTTNCFLGWWVAGCWYAVLRLSSCSFQAGSGESFACCYKSNSEEAMLVSR